MKPRSTGSRPVPAAPLLGWCRARGQFNGSRRRLANPISTTLGGTSARSRRRSPRMNDTPRCRRGDSRGHRHPQGLRDRLRMRRRATDVRLGQAHRIDSHRVTADAAEAARARAALRQAGIYGTRVTIHHRPWPSSGTPTTCSTSPCRANYCTRARCPATARNCYASSGQAAAYSRWVACRRAAWPSSLPGRPSKPPPLLSQAATCSWPGASRSMARVNGRIPTAPPRRPPTAATRSSTAAGWPCSGSANRRARGMTDRQGRNPPPLTSNGFLYVQGDNRIWGQDAFNGTILWNYEFPSELRRVNTPRDGSNMCADDSSLFVAMRDRAYRFDGRTGGLLRSFPVIAGGAANWGYIANDGDLLFGSSIKPGSEYTKFKGTPYWYDSTGTQDTAKICSDNLFAIDKRTGGKMGVPWRKNYQLQHRHRRRTRLLRRVQLVENPERANQPNRLQQPLVEPAPRRAQPEKTEPRSGASRSRSTILYPVVFFLTQAGSFNPQLHHHEVLRGRLLHP